MIFSWYHGCMLRRPYATQISTSVVVGAAGDMLAQYLACSDSSAAPGLGTNLGPNPSPGAIAACCSSKQGLDWHRVLIMSLYSGAFAAPLILVWLKALDKLPLRSLFARVAVDQVCFSPFGLAYYFVVTGFLYRQPWTTTQSKLGQDYPAALLRSYQIWPAVQAVNFYYVPLAYRLLFTQAAALGWNAYLSFLFHKRVRQT